MQIKMSAWVELTAGDYVKDKRVRGPSWYFAASFRIQGALGKKANPYCVHDVSSNVSEKSEGRKETIEEEGLN